MTNLVGTVTGKSESGNGYMVEVFIGGQYVIYGPMHFISPPIPMADVDRDPYVAGDKVFITNFIIRDQFVILGRYIDIVPVVTEPVQHAVVGDVDGDGIVDGIETTYEEPPA